MRYRGRWGGARAGWFPPEQPSPRGPALQGVRWDDPSAFARTARPCTGRRCVELGACDGRETALAGGALALMALLGGVAWRRRRRTAYAAAAALLSCHGVRIRGPSAVMAIVNSKWAASEPSWE